jgi:hypothetical protein
MAGLLDFIGTTRGRLQGYRDATRARILEPVLQELEDAAAQRKLAQERNAQNEQAVGLARQLNRSGLRNDPTAQQAVGLMLEPGSRGLGLQMAADRLNPQKQQELANAQLSGRATEQGMAFAANQDQRAERALSLDEQRTMAYINNMNYDNAAKVTATNLQAMAGALKSEGDLRNEYQKAPLLVKGAQAVGSWQMLKRSLDENNPMALQAAIVAAAQIQEPGLAVRNDDRIAYSGSNPVVERLVQSFNTAMSGEGLTPGMKQRLLALGTQLAGVHARNIVQITDEYRRLAVSTPGARSDQVTAGVGVDWDTVNFLAEVTDEKRRGPGSR